MEHNVTLRAQAPNELISEWKQERLRTVIYACGECKAELNKVIRDMTIKPCPENEDLINQCKKSSYSVG